MAQIEKAEALILLKGAIKMAQQDNQVVETEVNLLESIRVAAGIEPFAVDEYTEPIAEDITALASQLTSEKAKKAFLLALATVALVDGQLAEEELALFHHLAKRLQVGTINLHRLTYEKAEATMLRLLRRDRPKQLQSKQVSDFDLL